MPTEPLVPAEKDIIAALLKSVWEHGLIPEATHRAALNKLFCAFDAEAPMGYDGIVQEKGSMRHGYSQSAG